MPPAVTKADVTAGKHGKGRKPPAENPPPETPKEKKARTHLQVLTTKSNSVKNQYVSAKAEAQTLQDTIEKSDDWHFLHPAPLLVSAFAKMQDTTRPRFWADWTVMDPSKLKKTYSETDMINEFEAGLPVIDQAVEAVTQEITALKAAFHARIAAIKSSKSTKAARACTAKRTKNVKQEHED